MKKPILEIKNATLIKDDNKIFDSISLTINDGEHTAILGPNGSGKTSLLKLIRRDYYPSFSNDSYVRIFGKEFGDLFNLRKKIGMVSDNTFGSYDTNCSGLETVLSGFFGSIGIFSTHKINIRMKIKADKIMKFLEIYHLKNKKLNQMSSGEVNRFLVARALVNEPGVLILDEPTAHLDIKTSSVFLSYIQKIAQHNKTVIMVTHHIDDIIPEIDRIIMLKKGRIYKDGKKNDLMNNEILSELYEYNIKIKINNGFYRID